MERILEDMLSAISRNNDLQLANSRKLDLVIDGLKKAKDDEELSDTDMALLRVSSN
jgi:hypothetical protein